MITTETLASGQQQREHLRPQDGLFFYENESASPQAYSAQFVERYSDLFSGVEAMVFSHTVYPSQESRSGLPVEITNVTIDTSRAEDAATYTWGLTVKRDDVFHRYLLEVGEEMRALEVNIDPQSRITKVVETNAELVWEDIARLIESPEAKEYFEEIISYRQKLEALGNKPNMKKVSPPTFHSIGPNPSLQKVDEYLATRERTFSHSRILAKTAYQSLTIS